MADYDGSINIDTRIDTDGFNKGVKNIERSVKQAGGPMASRLGKMLDGVKKGFSAITKAAGAFGGAVVTTMTVAAVAVGVVVLALAALAALIVSTLIAIAGTAFIAGKAFQAMTDRLLGAMTQNSYMYSQVLQMKQLFLDLRHTLSTVFTPLYIAAMPIITQIVEWLIRMLNLIQMVIAALLGQRTVMQYVAGSAKAAAQGAGSLASETEKAKKAAEGALAAFDMINVLQKEEKPPAIPTGGGGGSLGELGEFVEVPIDNKILETVAKIKKWFADLWSDIKLGAQTAWKWVSDKAVAAWLWIVEKWGIFRAWFEEHVWGPLERTFGPIWDVIAILANNAWAVIKNGWRIAGTWFQSHVIAPIKNDWTEFWNSIEKLSAFAWAGVQITWNIAKGWFKQSVLRPLEQNFGLSLDNIEEMFRVTFEGIQRIVKGVINRILGFINSMVAGAIASINSLIAALNSVIGGNTPGWINIPSVPTGKRVPELASGAVIPPNAAFLAMLGDQRHGTNIEAPEDLIRQIVREESGAGREVTVNFAGSLGALVRELKPYIDRENTRVGTSLVKGATTK